MKERIVRREVCYDMDGISFRAPDGSMDLFLPIHKKDDACLLSISALYKIEELQEMGYKITFKF